jgi:hypothetical protein
MAQADGFETAITPFLERVPILGFAVTYAKEAVSRTDSALQAATAVLYQDWLIELAERIKRLEEANVKLALDETLRAAKLVEEVVKRLDARESKQGRAVRMDALIAAVDLRNGEEIERNWLLEEALKLPEYALYVLVQIKDEIVLSRYGEESWTSSQDSIRVNRAPARFDVLRVPRSLVEAAIDSLRDTHLRFIAEKKAHGLSPNGGEKIFRLTPRGRALRDFLLAGRSTSGDAGETK